MQYGEEYYDFCKNERGFDMAHFGEWQKEFAKMLHFTFNIPKEGKVLDVGTAMGANLEALRQRGMDCYGVDVSEWYIKNSPFQELKLFISVDNQLPFEDDTFDFVFSHQVVEHVPEEHLPKLLTEIRRVLKPGKVCFISTAIVDHGIEVEPTHISCFTRDIWVDFFEDAGFVDVSDHYIPKLMGYSLAQKSKDWVNFALRK